MVTTDGPGGMVEETGAVKAGDRRGGARRRRRSDPPSEDGHRRHEASEAYAGGRVEDRRAGWIRGSAAALRRVSCSVQNIRWQTLALPWVRWQRNSTGLTSPKRSAETWMMLPSLQKLATRVSPMA